MGNNVANRIIINPQNHHSHVLFFNPSRGRFISGFPTNRHGQDLGCGRDVVLHRGQSGYVNPLGYT